MSDQHTADKTRVAVNLVVATLVILALYLLTAWVVLPSGAFWSPDEGVKWLQMQNLRLEDGRFYFDLQYQGRDLDPDLEHVPTNANLLVRRQGKLYVPRLPIFSLASLPFFSLLGFQGLYVLPALAGALAGACALLLVWPNGEWTKMQVLIAFGSPIFIYSVLFWEHTLATCLCLLATCFALRGMSQGKRPQWIMGGLLLGLAAYLRLETVLYALGLVLACACVVWRAERRMTGPLVLGSILALIMIPYFPLHRLLFHDPVPANAAYVFVPLAYLRRAGWRAVPDFLLGPPTDRGLDFGPLGVLFSALVGVAIALSLARAFRPGSRLWRWAYWLALGCVALLNGLVLFSSQPYHSTHGFLLSTPWALLGLCRATEIWRRGDQRAQALTLTALFGLGAYAVGMLVLRGSSPHGGLEWGARFALTLYPLLAIMALWPLPAVDRRAATHIIWAAFLCLGIGFQLRGLRTIRADEARGVAWNQELAAVPEDLIVSDVWWLPLGNAPGYGEKPIFFIQGVGQLDAWVDRLDGEGVDTFCLVTFNSGLAQTLLQYNPSLRPWRWISVENLQFIGVQIQPASGSP